MADDKWSEQPTEDGRSNVDTKEWKLIEKVLMASGQEQKRTRRWGIFFKALTFVYLFALLLVFSPSRWMGDAASSDGPHTAMVEVQGLIAEGELASADNVVTGLRDAFEDDQTKAVILRINSPGGTPVQAGYIYDEILRLRDMYPDTKLYAVIGDLGASGGYYVAAAADEIYADKASLVGSIGVISGGFGFAGTMEKLGVERRLYTAGENKAFLDAFSPTKEGEKEFWEGVLKVTHSQFIEKVKQGRGARLQDSPELFSGLIWSGEQAKELGLIDGLGSPGYVAREIIGEENIVNFTPRRNPFEEWSDRLGVSIGKTVAAAVGFGGVPRLQ